MLVQERKEMLNRIFTLAKEGSLIAKDYLKCHFSLKVWTHEEIKGLNYLNAFLKGGGEVSYVLEPGYEGDRFIQHEDEEYKINWIDAIGEGFYLMGLTSSKHGGGGVYCATLDKEVGFKILFNTSYQTMEDLILKGNRLLLLNKEKEDLKDESNISITEDQT
jgi:hypothetical protein